MTSNSAYDELMAHVRGTVALEQVSGLLGWDQETQMPRGAAAQRAEQSSALEAVLHARQTDPRIPDWLGQIHADDMDQTAVGNLRLVRWSYDKKSKIPADLAVELARITSEAQGVWADARAAGRFADFKGILAEVLNLRRQEAQALSEDGNLYNALLDTYEPGMTADELDRLFGALRQGLVGLRQRINDSGVEFPELQGSFSKDQQMLIARELASSFGYDWERGRLDFSVHPFSSGSYNDVRITTRVAEADPFNCFYSTIHEVGHAVYEQTVDRRHGLTPSGRGASMGVHESQSRIAENQLGRSRAFTGYLYRRMLEVFGDFGIASEDVFYQVVNNVGRGFIRTEADEVQYNLHVMLRYDLERALIGGDLEVADLEAAWNDRFLLDFGYPVQSAADGVLQDVHWSVGLFGYFPTYSLGNIYAGELYECLLHDIPELQENLDRGDAGQAVAWMGERIHQHGSVLEPLTVIKQTIGHAPSEAPLMRYLNRKFGEIYDL
ncbi:MAG: carboxypeptidase M32 [Rhodobacteraceae bacterium]|nr:carboxypeptidase M32 [Paracoccaceae bacterium]